MSVAALEDPFYGELLERLGLRDAAPDRTDPTQRAALRELLAATFRQRSQAQWCAVFAGSDACCWPVLSMREAAEHPHLRERGVLVDVDGIRQPAPAPRFSRTPTTLTTGPSQPGEGGVAALRAWGIGAAPSASVPGGAVPSASVPGAPGG
jgi:alpha-methylacyl-CoA racemase